MKRDVLVSALEAVTDRLLSLASEDAQFRSRLRQLAEAFLEATAVASHSGSTARGSDGSVQTVQRDDENGATTAPTDGQWTQALEPMLSSAVQAPPEARPVLPELTLGRTVPAGETIAPTFPPHRIPATNDDLPLIESRCRLKAEGARWAATRRRRIAEGGNFAVEIEPRDQDIIARAKAIPECFLWMCHPSGPSPNDLREYDDVAGCFEVVADLLGVVKQIEEEPDLHLREFEQALDLLAEAQSALRGAIASMDDRPDHDQLQVFNWLKATANEHQVFIARHMRADDPANPAQWPELSARVEMLASLVEERRRQSKKRRKLLGKVRHKLSLIEGDPDGSAEHWRILMATVDELVSDGLPPSNRELRELLLPAIDEVPDLDEVPANFQLVLREIDRFLATSSSPVPLSTTPTTPEIRQVAEILEGRSVVLIGGVPRPANTQALKEAFRLRELIWIETREHQSIDAFEPSIANPDVAVVLLAIRWSSHSFGDVKDFCDRHEKPLVRLPGGYNPNQVAVQILRQCSERLKSV